MWLQRVLFLRLEAGLPGMRRERRLAGSPLRWQGQELRRSDPMTIPVEVLTASGHPPTENTRSGQCLLQGFWRGGF